MRMLYEGRRELVLEGISEWVSRFVIGPKDSVFVANVVGLS